MVPFITGRCSGDRGKAETREEKCESPLLMDAPHFGDAAHFARHLPAACLAANPAPFRARPRLVITGHCGFGPDALPAGCGTCHTAAMHARLDDLGIPHHYDNTLTVPHRWDAAWVAPVVATLLG